ncbi:TPA: hypothetical protein H1008_01230 [archaeon]|nr:hypothetical protein [Candidatus Undinarchaeales archaeon SRR5007147.bin71]
MNPIIIAIIALIAIFFLLRAIKKGRKQGFSKGVTAGKKIEADKPKADDGSGKEGKLAEAAKIINRPPKKDKDKKKEENKD